MSVTFFIPQAPTTKVQPYEDEPDFWDEEYISPYFDINMSNCNAGAFLREIDPMAADVLAGQWDRHKLQAIRRKLLRLINSHKEIQSLCDPAYQDGNFYYGGRDEYYILTRARAMLALVKLAMDNGYTISFG